MRSPFCAGETSGRNLKHAMRVTRSRDAIDAYGGAEAGSPMVGAAGIECGARIAVVGCILDVSRLDLMER